MWLSFLEPATVLYTFCMDSDPILTDPRKARVVYFADHKTKAMVPRRGEPYHYAAFLSGPFFLVPVVASSPRRFCPLGSRHAQPMKGQGGLEPRSLEAARLEFETQGAV